jgi:DNA transformation protein and related proteins
LPLVLPHAISRFFKGPNVNTELPDTANAGTLALELFQKKLMVSENYRLFVVEQLARVMPVTTRSMFGGVGIYARGLFFALIAEDRLYVKVNDRTRPEFEHLGMEPFRPFGEESAMGYYELPADVLEDAAQLALWVDKAIQVAAEGKKKAKPTNRNVKQHRTRKKS